MSAEINNREYRQEKLKEIIAELHEGKSVEEVKEKFGAVFLGVSAEEISQAEQALISGGLPVSEVQRLCDVHASVFKGSIEDIHKPADLSKIPGHPANTLKRENRALEKLLREIRDELTRLPNQKAVQALSERLEQLNEIDRHYKKKENLLFPFLEKYGITALPKVMWGVDDEIREELKQTRALLHQSQTSSFLMQTEKLLHRIEEMIFKEENIFLPILFENLTEDEWKQIAEDSSEFGYCLLSSVPEWNPVPSTPAEKPSLEASASAGNITLPTGVLSTDALTHLLNTLPVDITFVDRDGKVAYFSQGKERVFPRTVSVIGRDVSNCHPPASVHIVEKVVDDLKSGRKEREDFWLHLGSKYVLITYFAVRDTAGTYYGILEVTQNIKPIQDITGEKRLVNDTDA